MITLKNFLLSLVIVLYSQQMLALIVGQPAPLFSLKDQDGKLISLEENKGKKWTVLFFYPKADTPGCTKQACAFRDSLKYIESENAVVYGISTNNSDDLKAFQQKYKLNFELLSDPDGKICNLYETKMPLLTLSKRHTFILDQNFIIRYIDRDVDPVLDSKKVAAKIKELQLLVAPQISTPLLDEHGHPSVKLKQLIKLSIKDKDAFQESDLLDAKKVLALTQKHWLRAANQERWQIKEKSLDLKNQVWPLIEDLGMLKAKYPEQKHYEYALVLGATINTMQVRLDFLLQEWQKGLRFKQLVFLVGERQLDPIIENIDNLIKDYKIPKPVAVKIKTETDAARLLFQQLNPPAEWSNLAVLFVDTKGKTNQQGKWQRPNTEDTFRTWLTQFKPIPGTILAVSNNPNIAYQHSVLSKNIPPHFKLETVGAEAAKDTKFELILDNLARWYYNIVSNHF